VEGATVIILGVEPKGKPGIAADAALQLVLWEHLLSQRNNNTQKRI